MLQNLLQGRFPKSYEDFLVTVLRVSIAIIFIWFGTLKVLGYNPVFDLIYNSVLPTLAHGTGLLVLGIAEVFIGIMLLLNRALVATHVVLLLHLLGTFTTFIFGFEIIFQPHFPILSLDGEFVIKNIALAVAGLVILVHESRKK
jgi:putative oxidoreductase